jgi:hypothetical protein
MKFWLSKHTFHEFPAINHFHHSRHLSLSFFEKIGGFRLTLPVLLQVTADNSEWEFQKYGRWWLFQALDFYCAVVCIVEKAWSVDIDGAEDLKLGNEFFSFGVQSVYYFL